MRRVLLLAGLVLALAPSLRSGEIGSKLAGYTSAGAGVGALVGTAVATLPYLQSKNSWDFYTGAGIGLLAGSGVGFLLGVLDVATDNGDSALGPRPGLQLAWQPGGMTATYTVKF